MEKKKSITPVSSAQHTSFKVSDIENVLASIPALKGPLSFKEAESLREVHGINKIHAEKRIPCYMIFLQSLLHPFNLLLLIIAIGAIITEEYPTTGIISFMVIISTALRFWQEWKSESAVHSLLKLVSKSVSVIRYDDIWQTTTEAVVPAEDLVPGDWVIIRPGEVIPADGVVLKSKVFYVSQSALTGEAHPVEKYSVNEESMEKYQKFEEELRISEPERTKRLSQYKPMPKCQRFFRVIFGMKVKTHAQLDKEGYEMKESLAWPDHIFMGCQAITGTATARVTRTGAKTLFGRMANALGKEQQLNPFQQGVRRVSWMFFVTMIVMVPLVCIFQRVFLKHGWEDALIFSLSVAVGLTPEMLPMIVNANLAKGTLKMTAKKAIIKKMDAIINLGAVDVLCTDKTGTLTKSVVEVSAHVDPYMESSYIPIQIAFLNSYFQSVSQNPLDSAITAYFEKIAGPADPSVSTNHTNDPISTYETHQHHQREIDAFLKRYSRLDELPFDFVRRRLSILVKDSSDSNVYLICKGAVEETLSICTSVVTKDTASCLMCDVFPPKSNVKSLGDEFKDELMSQYASYTEKGQRVLAVAFKHLTQHTTDLKFDDEFNLTFVGFLAFIDPPKDSAEEAIAYLMKHKVEVKVLTGDAANICSSVCKQINLPVKAVVTGDLIEQAIENGTLSEVVERGTIFAKLTPLQKSLIVQTLKANDHVVAFMGDGINDSPALKEADVGISVDSGVDICRESADVILLDKDLNAVVNGVRVGRETYGNTIKYIAMAVSSNFGNVFSVLVASAWLPFEPMQSLHLLVQNLLYDISQVGIPWDSVDEEFLMVPHKWKTKSIMRFMVWMGPCSSAFDIATFAFVYYHYNLESVMRNFPTATTTATKNDIYEVQLFQTTWFMVGLLTQTLIVHMIRTAKIPLFQSRASWQLTTLTLVIMAIGVSLPYVPEVYKLLRFTNRIQPEIYYFIICVLVAYCIIANVAKLIYVKIFHEWF